MLVVGADNKVAYREVSLGPTVDGLRVVTKGLEPNERIVVNGLQHVKPGIAVAPTKVAMDGDRAGVAQLAAPDAAKTLVAARVSGASHSQR